MELDPIQNLLRQTDAANPAPLAGDRQLAAGARAALRRRQRRKMAATVAVGLAIVAVGIFTIRQPDEHPVARQSPETPATAIAIDMGDLKARDAAETETVALMLTAERQAAAARRLDELRNKGDVIRRLEDQREQIALTVLEGVAAVRSPADRPAIYHEVVQLFPDTSAATVARQRLEIH